MRLLAALAVLLLSGSAAAYTPPKPDEIQWGADGSADVQEVTDKVKAELEAKPDYAKRKIVVRRPANDLQVMQLVTKLPWITEIVTDEPAELTSLAPFMWLKGLRILHLNSNRVTTLRSLGKQPALEYLVVTCSPAFVDTDLRALAGAPNLQHLEIRGCKSITSLAGIEKLTNLTTFTSDAPITDVTPLAGLTKLQALYLRDSRVTDIAPLAGLTQVMHLSLTGMKLKSFAPLRSMTKLFSLDVYDTNITSFADLMSPALASVTAYKTPQLTSIDFGVPTPMLTMVFVDDSAIASIAPMAKHPSLTYLSFGHTKATDILSLSRLPKLTSITVPEQTKDADILTLKRARPGLEVQRTGKPAPGTKIGPPIP